MRWRRAAYRLVRPLLFAIDAERIHHLALDSLALAGRSAVGRALCAVATGVGGTAAGDAPVELAGLRFRNRVGLGAGFDKDAVAVAGWAAIGLGFVEIGTVTPRPQSGHPRPRLFRLARDRALVNRMGFNNAGAASAAGRLASVRPSLPAGFVVGANIGRNAQTPVDAATDDYVAAARALALHADYIAVNVSSPNTPGLRDLQDPARIGGLLEAVAAVEPRRPLFVKLAPDLGPEAFDELLPAIAGSPAIGLILSNTTTERAGLRSAAASEDGGLSGAPLLARTLEAVARARRRTGGRFVIVASGGIAGGDDARAALDAGADLVQLWTGLVYAGPALIGEAVRRTR